MQPNGNTTAYTGQAPTPPHVVDGGAGMTVIGLLVGAIIALAGAIAVLWRRSEKRAERQLKVAEETRERDAIAAAAALAREVARTTELAEMLANDRKEFATILERQRVEFAAILERQREDFGKMLHDIVTRQDEANRTQIAAVADLAKGIGTVLDAAQRRIVRVK